MGESGAVRIAATCAAFLSCVTLLVCVIMLPSIINEVNNIRNELDTEMVEFSVLSRGIWDDISKMGSSKVKRQATARSWDARRGWNVPGFFAAPVAQNNDAGANAVLRGQPDQTYGAPKQADVPRPPIGSTCNCNARNSCPPGPQGRPGFRGEAGTPGVDGLPGRNGLDAEPVRASRQQYTECFNCPRGMDGPIGRPGPPGSIGQRGQVGKTGPNGAHSRPGCPGLPGFMGPSGDNGRVGQSGGNGNDTVYAYPLPGSKGRMGPIGIGGEKGLPGPNAQRGFRGVVGPVGPIGAVGATGARGEMGRRGGLGAPGRDAQYCPCPTRAREPQRYEPAPQPSVPVVEIPAAPAVNYGSSNKWQPQQQTEWQPRENYSDRDDSTILYAKK